jgi:hypothetical protein
MRCRPITASRVSEAEPAQGSRKHHGVASHSPRVDRSSPSHYLARSDRY